MELSCPKCHGTMRTYERNGVHVDQCADCRGIFLDRGELDRLIDAENAWHGGQQRPDQGPREQRPARGSDLGAVVSDVVSQVRGSKHRPQHQPYPSQQYYGRTPYGQGYPKRKKSFLSELFD